MRGLERIAVWMLLTIGLCGCNPTICEEPCQGQSRITPISGGVRCWCGSAYKDFDFTLDDDVCAADRAWWAAHAPLPCTQPGGGGRKARP